ncbi:hypothetical protein D9M69_491850 [compost metagenome]
MDEHVHPRQGPGGAVYLFAEQRVVVTALRFHHLRGFNKQAARSAGRIADAVARLGRSQRRQQAGHHSGSVELARLLAGIGTKAFDQVDVGVADHVIGDTARAKIQLGEVFEQMLEPAVAVLGLAEVDFTV